MIGIAAAWIIILLAGGGYALDRVLTQTITRSFDDQIEYLLVAMIRTSEVNDQGKVVFTEPLGVPEFLEPYSGLYWQIDGQGAPPMVSRSLWDRTLKTDASHTDEDVHFSDCTEFEGEPLRVAERDVVLPGSDKVWRFRVAQARAPLDANLDLLRKTIIRSFAALGLGLIILAALQTVYGLWPLRRLRSGIAAMRHGERSRFTEPMPVEVQPVIDELNQLIAHNETQAAEARTHAGNLAHALKTPLTVIVNAATARDPDLSDIVMRESATMRRQVDHHLARARAIGRRGSAQLRSDVWASLGPVERAIATLYPHSRFDADGDRPAWVAIERQDLDDIVGNIVENAAKYGGGSVFASVSVGEAQVELLVEDDGQGIPEAERTRIFDRGVRLDSTKPGTGLGLAIVRDVVEIYGGSVKLEESEDLGGLLVRLTLPRAAGTDVR